MSSRSKKKQVEAKPPAGPTFDFIDGNVVETYYIPFQKYINNPQCPIQAPSFIVIEDPNTLIQLTTGKAPATQAFYYRMPLAVGLTNGEPTPKYSSELTSLTPYGMFVYPTSDTYGGQCIVKTFSPYNSSHLDVTLLEQSDVQTDLQRTVFGLFIL